MDTINAFIDNAPILLIASLISLIVIDYVTGLMRALFECRSNSKTHYKGIIKKLGIIVGVLVGAIADIVLSGGQPMFTSMVTMLFIAGEVLSIIENLGVMGVKLPNALTTRFEQIHQSDGKVNDDDGYERVKELAQELGGKPSDESDTTEQKERNGEQHNE